MSKSPEATTFDQLIDRYDGFLFDAYGVVNDSQGMIPGAAKSLEALSRAGKPFCVVSNDASRTPEEMAAMYRVGGKTLIPPERIVTSGLVAQRELTSLPEVGRVVFLGPESSAPYFEGLCESLTPCMDWKEGGCDLFALMDDQGFDWQSRFNHAVNRLRQDPPAHLWSPNPDLLYCDGPDRVGIATGALAKMLGGVLGREFRTFGKPDPEIFRAGCQRLGLDPEASRILMTGDNLATDIAGARRLGLDALLVFSGNTTRAQLQAYRFDEDPAPTYVADSLALPGQKETVN